MSLGTNIVLNVAFYMNSNKLVYLKSTVIVIYIYIYIYMSIRNWLIYHEKSSIFMKPSMCFFIFMKVIDDGDSLHDFVLHLDHSLKYHLNNLPILHQYILVRHHRL